MADIVTYVFLQILVDVGLKERNNNGDGTIKRESTE